MFCESFCFVTYYFDTSLYIIKRAKNLLFKKKALLSLYFFMVHCHLNYGLNLWGCANITNLKPVITKQKQAIGFIM
jgi:beta-xylosidase